MTESNVGVGEGMDCYVLNCKWGDGRPAPGHLQEAARNARYAYIYSPTMVQHVVSPSCHMHIHKSLAVLSGVLFFAPHLIVCLLWFPPMWVWLVESLWDGWILLQVCPHGKGMQDAWNKHAVDSSPR